MSTPLIRPASEDFDPKAVPIRNAATVMLVRDAEVGGIEVFMLRRTLKAVFASGMYVFPGGRLDDVDGGAEMEAVCDGLSDEHASAVLQIPSGGLAYWVAAIRECFEEAGVLLARSTDTGEVVRFDDPDVIARFATARANIYDSSLNLVQLCETEGLHLVTDAIHYTAHWVTPIGEQRRFDTRFFLARAPQAQEPLHDDGETIASLWTNPADALARERAGELVMLPPTIASLQFLAEHDTADAALAAAAVIGTPPKILPKVVFPTNGGPMKLLMPGDPGYDDAE
ncbi:MAG: NUDIX hydrolase [Ilumatobacteraceae bacterium]